jgi:hypothetical protein
VKEGSQSICNLIGSDSVINHISLNFLSFMNSCGYVKYLLINIIDMSYFDESERKPTDAKNLGSLGSVLTVND